MARAKKKMEKHLWGVVAWLRFDWGWGPGARVLCLWRERPRCGGGWLGLVAASMVETVVKGRELEMLRELWLLDMCGNLEALCCVVLECVRD